MPLANTKNLTTSLLDYLLARPGQRFAAPDLAKYFGCAAQTARERLTDLSMQSKIKSIRTRKGGRMYWAEAGAVAEPRQSPIRMRAYVMPATMQERATEAQAHRERFPSHYAGGK